MTAFCDSIRIFIYFATACLVSAQTSPPVYFGPYEQPHAAQFEGSWARSDGNYSLAIRTEGGVTTADYFNPDPIKVESTSIDAAEDGLILRIILRDQGYPGSTYELQYIPQFRVLAGSYAIPGQAPAEVFFTREE